MSDVVRHNTDTHRVVTACECGTTISLPDSGLSYERCGCGRVWQCDGRAIAMYEPKAWRMIEEGQD